MGAKEEQVVVHLELRDHVVFLHDMLELFQHAAPSIAEHYVGQAIARPGSHACPGDVILLG